MNANAVHGSTGSPRTELLKDLGSYVECKIDDLRIGANNIKIEIKDESGKNVTDAKVQVEYAMPEGIDLPPMNFKTDIKLEGDAYKGKIKIPMAGVWTTVINVM